MARRLNIIFLNAVIGTQAFFKGYSTRHFVNIQYITLQLVSQCLFVYKIKQKKKNRERYKTKKHKAQETERLGEVEVGRKTEGERLSGSDACWAGSQG